VKYEIPITYHSKDMANAKVFEKWVKLKVQGLKVKKKMVPIERYYDNENTYEI
jgi:hypothetical protein